MELYVGENLGWQAVCNTQELNLISSAWRAGLLQDSEKSNKNFTEPQFQANEKKNGWK